jgi:hypothetical protein
VSPSTECAEKDQLLEQIRAAMTAVVDLNNREMEAVIGGILADLEQIEIDLRRQRLIKENLLYAYRVHVQTHGC